MRSKSLSASAAESVKRYRVVAAVREIRGKCPIYNLGDKIVFEGFCIKSSDSRDICIHVFSAMSTLLSAFLHGTSAKDLGIGSEPDTGYIQCPDPGRPYTKGGTVIFELTRQIIQG